MSTAQSTAEAPKANPFAIMRNVHEALRASIASQRGLLDAGDLQAFAAEWSDFGRGLAVHMAMEDAAVFPLLDELGAGVVTAGKLPDEHLEDVRLATAVDAALAAAQSDAAEVRTAWSAWADDHLHHLLHEEEVMMPLTPKTAPTPEGRARVVHDRLLSSGERQPDFDWFVGWVTRTLNGYGSETMPANAALRGFASGLQAACSPAQWKRLRPVVRSNCGEALWLEISSKLGLDADGPIVD
jgi:hypothetical protein